MRVTFLAILLLATASLFSQTTNIQQRTSVNTDGTPPDASAILDVNAPDKGMLTPRMTTAQRTAITSPATGLLVYDTDTGSFWYYENSAWNELAPASPPSESGANTTGGNIPDNDPAGITSIITLADPGTVTADTRFRVCLDISHNYTGDLDISLEAPDGTTIILAADNGFAGDNYKGACLTTEAINPINGEPSPFTGNWQPEEPFANFIGKTIAGDWKLKVVDDESNLNTTGGQLNFWSLKLSQPSATTTLLADADGDTRVTVEDLPDEDIVRIEAGGGNRLEMSEDISVFSKRVQVLGNFESGSSNNTAFSNFAFVGGGGSNNASGPHCFVGGGILNTASGLNTFVGGGDGNTASDFYSFIGGGVGNIASNSRAFVGGGLSNSASGENSFVGSGESNSASGKRSFVGGGIAGVASGENSLVGGGVGNSAKSYAEAVFGTYSTDSSPTSTTSFNAADRVFVIGNGTSDGSRSNAFTVLKNGNIGIGTETPGFPISFQNVTEPKISLFTSGGNIYGFGVSSIQANYHVPSFASHVFYADGTNGDGTELLRIKGDGALISTNPGTSPDGSELSFNSPGGDIGIIMRRGDGSGGVSQRWDLKVDDDNSFRIRGQNVFDWLAISSTGNVGLGRTPLTNDLEVEGTASKSSAGNWLSNSDARLKKNIRPLDSEAILQKMLSLRGITYEWDDDQTGSKRPEGMMYGFTAQNIQTVFPELVEEDNLGFLQTAYGTYDAMTVEAMRALYREIENGKLSEKLLLDRIEKLESENTELTSRLAEMDELKNRMARLEAALLQTTERETED